MKISGLFVFIAMAICLFSVLTTHTTNACNPPRKEGQACNFEMYCDEGLKCDIRGSAGHGRVSGTCIKKGI